MGHYSNHLGRQALSFLKHLMIKQGKTRHEMPEYFEDDFYTMMKNYPSLNGYILSYYEEGKRRLENEKCDIIAKAIKDYTNIQIEDNRPIDSEYIVHFYQKYEWDDKWEECTVIVYCDGFPIGAIEFSDDFYEGQTEVKDIVVMSLHEVGDLLGKAAELVKEMKQDEKK